MGKYLNEANGYTTSVNQMLTILDNCNTYLKNIIDKLDVSKIETDTMTKNVCECINGISEKMKTINDSVGLSQTYITSKARSIDDRLERLAQKKSDEKTFTAVEEKF